MNTRLEKNRKPGVCYALAPHGPDDELELPIVDVTHPAFALALTDQELAARVASSLAEQRSFDELPPQALQLLRESILGQGIGRSAGSFLSGLGTYLLKLGPDNLGDAYAKPIDRVIASTAQALCVRLRLQDMATLLAEALAPRLAAAAGRPLRLVNVAGGPAMDSLNALILLRRDHPQALAGRRVAIDVLDQDADGPTFGARALAALTAAGGPLAAVDAQLRAIRSSWSDTGPLREVLRDVRAEGAVAVGSSEGGLFEYGSDDDIAANLGCLRDEAPDDFVMTGSVTRDDEISGRLRRAATAVRPRGLEVFAALAARSGWRIAQAIGRPPSDQVALVRAR